MKKKILITVPLVLIILFLIYGYIYCNLKVNSVYYAKHTPHKKGTEPVLMMLVDNLDWIYNPDIDGIEYDFDGKPAILTFDKNNEQTGYFTTLNLYGEKGYLFNHDNLMYSFNSKFILIYASDANNDYKDIDISKINDATLKKNIIKVLKPLIDEQPKPFINLQWLFDKIYRDKFN